MNEHSVQTYTDVGSSKAQIILIQLKTMKLFQTMVPWTMVIHLVRKIEMNLLVDLCILCIMGGTHGTTMNDQVVTYIILTFFESMSTGLTRTGICTKPFLLFARTPTTVSNMGPFLLHIKGIV